MIATDRSSSSQCTFVQHSVLKKQVISRKMTDAKKRVYMCGAVFAATCRSNKTSYMIKKKEHLDNKFHQKGTSVIIYFSWNGSWNLSFLWPCYCPNEECLVNVRVFAVVCYHPISERLRENHAKQSRSLDFNLISSLMYLIMNVYVKVQQKAFLLTLYLYGQKSVLSKITLQHNVRIGYMD